MVGYHGKRVGGSQILLSLHKLIDPVLNVPECPSHFTGTNNCGVKKKTTVNVEGKSVSEKLQNFFVV